MTSIVKHDIQSLIDQWLEDEQNGVQFPVDFDVAWPIAGYSTKGNAKRKLTAKSSCLTEGEDYVIHPGVPIIQSDNSELSGRSSDKIVLTCDGFKHLSLIAQTDEGRLIRQYFIEAEKKWRAVQKVDPAFAQQIELLTLQSDIAKANAIMMENQRIIMEKSEAIVMMHGVQMLALIQGRPGAVVEKVEKVTETVVCRDGQNVSFEGKSLAELGKELGFKTGKEFERWLIRHNRQDVICEGMRAVQAPYIPTEFIPKVKELWTQTRKAAGTQLLIGE